MFWLTTNIIAGLTCLGVFTVVLLRISKARSQLPRLPGPPRLPIIGNLLQSPKSHEWETYKQWDVQYDCFKGSNSGIIQFDVAGSSVVVINSAEVASDLLEKRSRIYSSRPTAPMVYDLMGWNWNFGFQPYGESCPHVMRRARRHAFSQTFNANAARSFYPQEIKATHRLLLRLLEDPKPFREHLRHHAAGVVMSVAYGIEIQPHKDPYVTLAEDSVEPLLFALVPGTFLVDSFPFLKHVPSWFPGAGFKRKARVWKEQASKMVNEPFLAAKKMIDTGKFMPSFISLSLDRIHDSDDSARLEEKEKVIREAAGSMYLAGSDTTVAALCSFIYAMTLSPEIQRKAQEELDSVIPPGRLPAFDDEKSLPYVTAIVWEALRWQNVTPLGIPHYLEVEDEYRGCRVPANSVVISNVWAILHDERLYPDPFEFKPERYLKDGKIDETVQAPLFAAFGFGRRVCPGRHVAYSSVWIATASILKTFNISKAVDDKGHVIEPMFEPENSIVATPKPFRCAIKPRSAEAEALILASTREVS
uniref:Cytochrome P450 n=1 Tax=Moniliophthora roreri TaxID=221103 RepID=A0A0W0F4A8_MONRR